MLSTNTYRQLFSYLSTQAPVSPQTQRVNELKINLQDFKKEIDLLITKNNIDHKKPEFVEFITALNKLQQLISAQVVSYKYAGKVFPQITQKRAERRTRCPSRS